MMMQTKTSVTDNDTEEVQEEKELFRGDFCRRFDLTSFSFFDFLLRKISTIGEQLNLPFFSGSILYFLNGLGNSKDDEEGYKALSQTIS